MKCENYKIMISALMDGELTEKEKTELFDHMQTCKDCQREIEEAIDLESMLEDVKVKMEVPSNITLPEWSEVESQIRPMRVIAWRRLVLPMAASVLFFIGMAVLVRMSGSNHTSDADESLAYKPLTEAEQVMADFTMNVLVASDDRNLDEIVTAAASKHAIEQVFKFE